MIPPFATARGLLNPADPPWRAHEKLLSIVEVLMRRVEQDTNLSGAGYAQFERAAMLEEQVRARTGDLEAALDLLNESNGRLASANRETEAARRNLADAIEAVQEGFALFGADDILVMCNSRFGLQMPDIRARLHPGQSFAAYIDMVSASPDLLLPEGTSSQDWAIDRLRRHRESSVLFTIALTRDRWLQVSEHRTGDHGTVIVQTDVTAILRAERAARVRLLDDQARVVRATLDHISQGVCIFDADAHLIGWNERAAELLAVDRARFHPGLSFADLQARLGEHLNPGTVLRAGVLLDWVAQPAPRPPLRFEMQRGRGVVLDAFAQQMPDRGFVISFTDVSVERRAIAALSRANETLEARVGARTLELGQALATAERANASRARFVAAASHDLLQPLSAAKLFLASMDEPTLPPRAQEALVKSRSALASVETIMEALLDISRLEIGSPAFRPQPVALLPLLSRLTEEFAPMAAERRLGLRLRAPPLTVISDPTWLRRIVQNLVSNALRYTETGRVLIGLRTGAAGLRIEVTDTGPGIPEEAREVIFREFHRLNARASAADGMGLGLAIVERAAALLGHAITLDSRLGHGSRFVVHLGPALAPSAVSTSQTAATAPLSSGARLALRPDLIGLLVAPDPDMRRALAHLLEGWGVNVLDVPDPDEADALLAEIGIAPDFILIDAPAGGETAALALIGTLAARHGPRPARLISATRAEGLRLSAARAGAPLLYKPIDLRQLERFIAASGRPA